MSFERREVDLSGGCRAWVEHGLIEFEYVGQVQAETTRRALELAMQPSMSDGAVSAAAVYVINLRKLEGFSSDARKVFSQMRVPEGPMPTRVDLYLYIAGATIRGKAVFSLVLAAASLVSLVKFHPEYIETIEEARARAHAKRSALIESGVIPPVP